MSFRTGLLIIAAVVSAFVIAIVVIFGFHHHSTEPSPRQQYLNTIHVVFPDATSDEDQVFVTTGRQICSSFERFGDVAFDNYGTFVQSFSQGTGGVADYSQSDELVRAATKAFCPSVYERLSAVDNG